MTTTPQEKQGAHTKGPWRFVEDGCSEDEENAGRPLTICGPNNDDIANVYSCDDTTVPMSREEALANARLIASAPMMAADVDRLSGQVIMWAKACSEQEAITLDLLKAAKRALYEMVKAPKPRVSFKEAVDALDAAIARATGQTP